jgi:hypothetical protein
MAVLKLLSLAAGLTGCYAPELRDCAVTCAANSDCGPGQICGGDQLCAAPAIAGHCNPPPTPDAAVSHDASPDAVAATVDASTVVTLQIEIKGHGRVEVAGIGSCSDAALDHTCTFTVPVGIPRVLHAVPGDSFVFAQWEPGACTGDLPTCTVTPTTFTLATAKFKHG